MVKNYASIFLFVMASSSSVVCLPSLTAQEVKVFTLENFDLKGKVKSCLVITNYGKEEFDFNEKGFLVKSVTRYNDADYDITLYKYSNNELIEKRVENYREGIFDRGTSFANFYTIDSSSGKKITEKIVSYNKEFLGQNEYVYDSIGQLTHIKHVDREGLDEIALEYKDFKSESTVNYVVDGVVQKSIRTSERKGKANTTLKVVLTKEFLNGEPNKALEQIYNSKNKVILETKFIVKGESKKFIPNEVISFTYNELGMMTEMKAKSPKGEQQKKYIYQYDNGEEGNWIKQIITPENTYTTRRIQYFEEE